MNALIDRWLEPGLWLLGDWSLRWGVLIAALGLWFAVRPPRQAGLRLAACQFVLLAGLALPLIPHWWGHGLLPLKSDAMADDATSARDTLLAPNRAPHAGLPDPMPPRLAAPGGAASQSESELVVIDDRAPAAEPLGALRIVLLFAAALWCVGTCVQLARLIAGAIGLSRLSRVARQPCPQAAELFASCCAEMNLRRPVRLGIHPTLAAPVFVGGRRPHVLVPVDWEHVTPDSQRAVLWHELTHAARRDDLAKLFEEAVRAVFFFHPLVHWLLNRLDAYREQVCDAAALRHGIAGRTLAEILVDFSRRKSEPHDRTVALRPALPFFRRRTVKNRIHELLDETTVARWAAPLLRRQSLALSVLAIASGMALGGFGARAADSRPQSLLSDDSQPPATAAPPAAPEKKAAAAGGPPITSLDRILANWKARSERTRSLYFTWDSRLFSKRGATQRHQGKAPAEPALYSGRVSYWSEGTDRLRIDVEATDNNNAAHPAKRHWVKNGTTVCTVEDQGPAAGPPIATLTHRTFSQTSIFTFLAINPLDRAFRPADSFRLNRGALKLHVLSENSLVEGRRCVEIQNGNDSGSMWEKCWVDPARADLMLAYELWFRRNESHEPDSRESIEYRDDPTSGWLPARWTYDNRSLVEANVTKAAINEQLPADTFSLAVAPGTLVFDELSSERYRATADGGKADVVKFDSPASVRVAEALESRSDAQIEPQSFQDAIDFISARYQIPIILKKDDFDAAHVDGTTEVVVKRRGIKIADLLKDLSAQLAKPFGFRIEDEVLKISPKFNEHGALHIGSATALPQNASEKERKIQEALEMPVDFNIEPQSLKDALDFIMARYQIRIWIDRRIDSTTEVKAGCPGIKLRSLLNILLEQCPKKLGFSIADDSLQIHPVAAPK